MRGGRRLPVGGAATIERRRVSHALGARRERKTSGPPSAALCDKTVRVSEARDELYIPRMLYDF
jgi:hypothetical protein